MSTPINQLPSDNNPVSMGPSYAQITGTPNDGTGYKIRSCNVTWNNATILMVGVPQYNAPIRNGRVSVILGGIGNSPSQTRSSLSAIDFDGSVNDCNLSNDFDCDPETGDLVMGAYATDGFRGQGFDIPRGLSMRGNVNLGKLQPPIVYNTTGINKGDHFAYPTRRARGMNGIRTSKQDVFCSFNIATCYIVWNPPLLRAPINKMSTTEVLEIYGVQGSRFGYQVRTFVNPKTDRAGVAFSAPWFSNKPGTNSTEGAVYILWANPDLVGNTGINITDFIGRNETRGCIIVSNSTEWQFGYFGVEFGIVNNKFTMVGNAPFATFKTRPQAGITTVVYLTPGMGSTFNISLIDGSNGCFMGGAANELSGYALAFVNRGNNNGTGLFLTSPFRDAYGLSRVGGGYDVSTLCQTPVLDLPDSVGKNGVSRYNASAVANRMSGLDVAIGDFDNDLLTGDVALGGTDIVEVFFDDATPVITNVTVIVKQNSTVPVKFISATVAGKADPNITFNVQMSGDAYYSLARAPRTPITEFALGWRQNNQVLFTTGISRIAPTCSIAAASPRRFAARTQPVPCDVHFSLLPPYLANNTVWFRSIGQAFPVTTDNIGPIELGLDRMPDSTIIYFSNDPNSKFCNGANPSAIASCNLGEMRPGTSSITFIPLSDLAPAVSVTIFDPVNNLISDPIPLRFAISDPSSSAGSMFVSSSVLPSSSAAPFSSSSASLPSSSSPAAIAPSSSVPVNPSSSSAPLIPSSSSPAAIAPSSSVPKPSSSSIPVIPSSSSAPLSPSSSPTSSPAAIVSSSSAPKPSSSSIPIVPSSSSTPLSPSSSPAVVPSSSALAPTSPSAATAATSSSETTGTTPSSSGAALNIIPSNTGQPGNNLLGLLSIPAAIALGALAAYFYDKYCEWKSAKILGLIFKRTDFTKKPKKPKNPAKIAGQEQLNETGDSNETEAQPERKDNKAAIQLQETREWQEIREDIWKKGGWEKDELQHFLELIIANTFLKVKTRPLFTIRGEAEDLVYLYAIVSIMRDAELTQHIWKNSLLENDRERLVDFFGDKVAEHLDSRGSCARFFRCRPSMSAAVFEQWVLQLAQEVRDWLNNVLNRNVPAKSKPFDIPEESYQHTYPAADRKVNDHADLFVKPPYLHPYNPDGQENDPDEEDDYQDIISPRNTDGSLTGHHKQPSHSVEGSTNQGLIDFDIAAIDENTNQREGNANAIPPADNQPKALALSSAAAILNSDSRRSSASDTIGKALSSKERNKISPAATPATETAPPVDEIDDLTITSDDGRKSRPNGCSVM